MTKPLAEDEKWIWICSPMDEEGEDIASYCLDGDPFGTYCSKCPCGMRRRVKKDDPRYIDELEFMGW